MTLVEGANAKALRVASRIRPAAGDAAAADSLRASDLELLSSALRERLERVAAGGGSASNMAECLADLDRLHALLSHETVRSRCRIAELRSALAAAYVGERRARRRAGCDPLTRLPNRDVFLTRLADALTRSGAGAQVAVLYLDLDHFKAINDRHGHGTGDAVLRIVAARLTAAVRADDLVCRIGGDEFACVLSGAPDRAALRRIATKLLDAVAAPLGVGALCLEVRPSIGIASWPGAGTTSDALVANADAAMYHAKRRRCGHAFFEEASPDAGMQWSESGQASLSMG